MNYEFTQRNKKNEYTEINIQMSKALKLIYIFLYVHKHSLEF